MRSPERAAGFPSTHIKVIMFKYNSNLSIGDANFWQGVHPGSASNPVLLRVIDTVDTSKIRVLKQVIIRPLHSNHSEYQCWLNLKNEKIRYPNQGVANASTPEKTDIGFAVVACNHGNLSTMDQVAHFTYAWKFLYKDP